MNRPLRVWKYQGWCAICRCCKVSVAIGCESQPRALELALDHLKKIH